MKTLVGVLIAGALSTTGVFAGAAETSPNVAGNGNTIATQRPFQPFHKRPAGARQAALAATRIDVAAPQLPFRPYQKRPTGTPSNRPSGIEAKQQ
jgi:hypothetical protein